MSATKNGYINVNDTNDKQASRKTPIENFFNTLLNKKSVFDDDDDRSNAGTETYNALHSGTTPTLDNTKNTKNQKKQIEKLTITFGDQNQPVSLSAKFKGIDKEVEVTIKNITSDKRTVTGDNNVCEDFACALAVIFQYRNNTNFNPTLINDTIQKIKGPIVGGKKRATRRKKSSSTCKTITLKKKTAAAKKKKTKSKASTPRRRRRCSRRV
jgi:hypothetical protein